MTTPVSIGRTVLYTLSKEDADQINRRRIHASVHSLEHQENSNGVIVHTGNRVQEGNIVPMIVVRVWNEITGLVNGHAILDGNDSLWVTSVSEDKTGEGQPRTWSWPKFIPTVNRNGKSAVLDNDN